MRPLAVANTIVGLASSAFGVLALTRPSALDAEPSGFYARMYAARAIPLGMAVAASCVGARPSPALLAAAAGAQAGDALIGIRRRSPGMAVTPLVGAVLHTAMAVRPARGRS